MERNEAIVAIRTALKRRSGKMWSVKGNRGTAWGWIDITSPPSRQVNGNLTPEDAAELGQLLGFDKPVHQQGVSIAASSAYRQEHVDRANGLAPSVVGQQYWD